MQDIGLDASDDLVAALADRLRGVLGEHDIAARFGEHQFAVLARNSDHEHTAQLAESLRAAFADHVIEVGARSLNATVSIGGVQIGEKIASVTQILAKASHGVQSSAGVGGNRAEIFDPSAVDRAEEERVQAWVTRIQAALDGNGFVLHYQPVISLRGELGEMYEAFLRLQGTAGELVQPLDFLPIAEEHGLMWEIDRWVVGRAIAVIGERARAGQTHRDAGEDHPGLAAGRHAWSATSASSSPRTRCPANGWCWNCPSPRYSPTCAPRRSSAPRWRSSAAGSAWSSSAPG